MKKFALNSCQLVKQSTMKTYRMLIFQTKPTAIHTPSPTKARIRNIVLRDTFNLCNNQQPQNK